MGQNEILARRQLVMGAFLDGLAINTTADLGLRSLPPMMIPELIALAGVDIAAFGLYDTEIQRATEFTGNAHDVGEKLLPVAGKLAEVTRQRYREINEKQRLGAYHDRKWEAFTASKDPAPTPSETLVFARNLNYKTQEDLGEDIGISNKTLSGWETGARGYDRTKLGELAENLTRTPRSAELFITLMRPDIVQGAPNQEAALKNWLCGTIERQDWQHISYPALDDTWLNAQLPNQQAGMLLTDLMELHQVDAMTLDTAIGATEGRVAAYARGRSLPEGAKLGALTDAIGCSERNAKRFITRARPDLFPKKATEREAVEEWLDNVVAKKKWDSVSYPALDDDWLKHQPEREKSGLILRDLIRKKDMEYDVVAEATGMDRASVSNWVNAVTTVPKNKLGEVVSALDCSVNDAKRFIMQTRPNMVPKEAEAATRIERWLAKKIQTKKWDAISYPALDDTWIEAQPEKLRAGLVLFDLRQSKGVSLDDLSAAMGVSKSMLLYGENGEKSIATATLGSIADTLALSPAETERFVLCVRPSFLPEEPPEARTRSQQWLRKTIKAKAWERLHLPALDKAWLDLQPEREQAGLLLHDLMQRQQMTNDTLSSAIGINSPSLMSNWCKAKRPIPIERVPAIMEALRLTSDEKSRFLDTVQRSNAARTRMAGASVELAKVTKLDEHPELIPPEAKKSKGRS